MRTISEFNPISGFTYYMCILLPLMFKMEPMLSLIGLISGGLTLALTDKIIRLRDYAFYILLPLFSAALNALLTGRGATVLFLINNRPVTKEALCFGLEAGMMISGSLIWLRSFSAVMSSDKLLYIFGGASPKTALILSMTLRYIPLYRRQARIIRNSRKALGMSREESIAERLRGEMNIFSALVSWALENGVVTADSMAARGYGCGKRTCLRNFCYGWEDCILTLASAALCLPALLIGLSGEDKFEFYPLILAPEMNVLRLTAFGLYIICAMIPALLEFGSTLRWKYLKSKI